MSVPKITPVPTSTTKPSALGDDDGNFECTNCVNTTDSSYSSGCVNGAWLRFCKNCVDTQDSSFCSNCQSCTFCVFCTNCSNCKNSTSCSDCVGCNGCTGCQGCTKEDNCGCQSYLAKPDTVK